MLRQDSAEAGGSDGSTTPCRDGQSGMIPGEGTSIRPLPAEARQTSTTPVRLRASWSAECRRSQHHETATVPRAIRKPPIQFSQFLRATTLRSVLCGGGSQIRLRGFVITCNGIAQYVSHSSPSKSCRLARGSRFPQKVPPVIQTQKVPSVNPRGRHWTIGPHSWGHPSIRESEAASQRWGHPSVRTMVGATRQLAEGSVPPPNPRGSELGPPPVRLRQISRGPKQCHPSVQARNSATRQFRSPPNWCHPLVRARQPGAKTVPPPKPGGGSGVVDPGLSAQSCSRSPALVASGASPTAADCA